MEFFDSLDPLLKTFWFIAIPVSLIFLVQTILTFVGAGTEVEIDFETDEPSFQVFSFRNLINFLLGFSWSGISFFESINNTFVLIGLSFFIGVLFVYVFFLIINQLQKLSENNSFNIVNTLNQTAEVYLTIPGNKSGKGKILISVKGAFHELDAVTDGDTINTGIVVRVVKIESDNLLNVNPIN